MLIRKPCLQASKVNLYGSNVLISVTLCGNVYLWAKSDAEITPNNHKKAFDIQTDGQNYLFPYAKLDIQPLPDNRINKIYIDAELGNKAFTYELESGDGGTVHIDHVLEYNRNPRYLRDMLLYKLTRVVQERVQESPLSKRELIRRLETSPAQFSNEYQKIH
ncbi:hypothetical protein MNBD_CHLOROFLEXI01-1419 [hydrothermal vent metagenome]|uniref:Uncharacterized protein n=1 Tax=hydrothermal vent metagenome TaxID=652676 RepID=A0A3B0UHS9_9ZZZZ